MRFIETCIVNVMDPRLVVANTDLSGADPNDWAQLLVCGVNNPQLSLMISVDQYPCGTKGT